MRTALAVVGVIAFIAVLTVSTVRNRMREAAEVSAARSIYSRVDDAIKRHKEIHGKYPAALEELSIDFTNSDGATEKTLELFRYEPRNNVYVLELRE